jgi:hypothetical protein
VIAFGLKILEQRLRMKKKVKYKNAADVKAGLKQFGF